MVSSYYIPFHNITIPRPPLYTLFPYTTLFRSLSLSKVNSVLDDAEQHAGAYDFYIFTGGTGEMILGGKIDRKSTRLNSSHLGISYAVFCLKKKKKNYYFLNL